MVGRSLLKTKAIQGQSDDISAVPLGKRGSSSTMDFGLNHGVSTFQCRRVAPTLEQAAIFGSRYDTSDLSASCVPVTILSPGVDKFSSLQARK